MALGPLQDDVWTRLAYRSQEASVQPACLALEHALGHIHTSGLQTADAIPIHRRERITMRDDHKLNTAGDDQVGTWSRAAMVRARFQVHVEHRILRYRFVSERGQARGLSMWPSCRLMPAFGEYAVLDNKDGAHHRIGGRGRSSQPGQFQATSHPGFVGEHAAAKLLDRCKPGLAWQAYFWPLMGIMASENSVAAVLEQYKQQLSGQYDEGETRAIARLIFHERLGWDAAQLELRKLESLHESDLLKVYLPLKRLRSGEPVQHVLGKVRFHGLEIVVSPDVLIPRPETEELVELIADRSTSPSTIIDIGTGSGCIALALKARFPDAHMEGIDVSEPALKVARRNAERLGLSVSFMAGDALKDSFRLREQVDIVVSNPPYIPADEEESLAPLVRAREPYIALFAPKGDPLAFFRSIGIAANLSLRSGGELWFEGHWRTAAAAAALLRGLGYAPVELISDLSGKYRFIRAVK